MDNLHRFMALLDIKGIAYAEHEDSVQFILRSGAHKWKCAVTAEESGYICVYSRYPWQVCDSCRDRLLRTLNELNTGLAAGCFMLHDGSVMLRSSVYIADPLLFADVVQQHFSSAAALTESAWNRIYSVLYSPED
ncbi:MAG: hypothetical protein ACI4KA_05920 [Oscillospiraceae bacterium]